MKHSVAGVAITQGKVFIARRKAGGDLGGKWEFPGGKVEEGEGDADALRREYFEEFGVAVTVGALLANGEFSHNGQGFSLNAYRIFFESHRFILTEHSEWRWVALEEIETLDFAGSDRLLLPRLQAYLETQAGVEDR
jgi:8-oxo-dGTP diphosphatase